MATAKIVAVGPTDLDIITDLYNEMFSPPQDEEFFRRRFMARHNVSMFVAELEQDPVGFSIGFELMPSTYFCWLCGVIKDARRLGIATQLMHALLAFAHDHEYTMARFECQNQHRPMLHVAITEGFDLTGIRWDSNTSHNVAIFEKELH